MLLIFLDTETTGLNPENHRAIEIAYKIVVHETDEILVSYQSMITPSAEVWAAADPKSLEVNGFSYEELLEGKSEQTVSAEIIEDFNRAELSKRGGVFICQNPSFDRAFFNKIISVNFQNEANWPYHWLDLASMYWARTEQQITQENELSKNSIAKALGLPTEPHPHRAMNGVEHLMVCYEKLKKKSSL